MHGHRHTDWIGECAGLRIVSAPSPVMEATDTEQTCFRIQALAVPHEAGFSCCHRNALRSKANSAT